MVDAECAYSRTGEGLHRFVDPEDGEVYLYTQYEPADARRVFANFEQPDLKAPFTFVVTAPGGLDVSWSNGADGTATADGGWHVRRRPRRSRPTSPRWSPALPLRRPTLPRHLRGRHDQEIPLGALCRGRWPSTSTRTTIFTVTKQGLDFFHEHFDYPYPFGKYDQAFVPEYNLGAMENPGCVTFSEEFIFRGKVTARAYEGRANVILHEMAHMWFGDLVTMRWWDDLWLKESFADFMGSLVTGGGHRVRRRAGSPSPTAARRGPTAPTSCPPPTRSPPTSATWRTPS